MGFDDAVKRLDSKLRSKFLLEVLSEPVCRAIIVALGEKEHDYSTLAARLKVPKEFFLKEEGETNKFDEAIDQLLSSPFISKTLTKDDPRGHYRLTELGRDLYNTLKIKYN